MKIAVSASGENIATTFDFVDEIVVFEYVNGNAISKQRFVLDEKFIPLRAAKLKRLKINTLICGAISNPATNILRYYGITVMAGITGNIDKITDEVSHGNSNLSKYKLPGFAGKGCCHQIRRPCQKNHNEIF